MLRWTHMSQPPNGILIGSAAFFAYITARKDSQCFSMGWTTPNKFPFPWGICPTDRQTDRQIMLRAISAATGHIYAMRAMRPNSKKHIFLSCRKVVISEKVTDILWVSKLQKQSKNTDAILYWRLLAFLVGYWYAVNKVCMAMAYNTCSVSSRASAKLNWTLTSGRIRLSQWHFYRGGVWGTKTPEFGLAPRLPRLFEHSAYNVPYTTGVVAPQIV